MSDHSARNALSGAARAVKEDARRAWHDAIDLFRELGTSMQKAKQVPVLIGVGAAVVFLGAIVCCFMLVDLVQMAMPSQPRWIPEAIVGVPFVAIGIGLLAWGRKRLAVFDPIHDQSAKVKRDTQETVDQLNRAVRVARQSVHETVESVRETLSVREQVNRRPATMMIGAISVGLLGGSLLHRDADDSPPSSGNGASRSPGVASSARGRREGFLSRIARKLEPEIGQLKGLAIAELLGAARDALSKAAPAHRQQVDDAVNGIAVKLGSNPVNNRSVR